MTDEELKNLVTQTVQSVAILSKEMRIFKDEMLIFKDRADESFKK